MAPARFIPLLALVLAACTPGAQAPTGTINVPPPPPAAAEPSPLAFAQPSTDHVHAMLPLAGGSMLIATHTGVRLAQPGATPQPTGGQLRGDVLALVRVSAGTVLLAGHNLGVQVSHDGGASWRPVAPEVTGLDVHGLAADPRDPTRVWAYAVGRGVLASTDGGAHWTHVAGWADGHYISGLCVTADGTLLAGSPELGVAASTDHGSTFVAVNGSTGAIYSIAASATDADVVVVAARNGLFLTQDGGKDWSNGITAVAITAVAVDPADPHRL